MLKVASLQMTSTPDFVCNLNTAKRLIEQAATAGAKLFLLPEYWPLMGHHDQDKTVLAHSPEAPQMVAEMAQQAKHFGCTIVAGTVPLKSPQDDKVYNSTLVFNPQGEQIARYDKIHLFGFSNGQESYQESTSIVAGNTPITFDTVSDTQSFKVGLSICYDLRFPELYRAFGVTDLIVVPAAFTYTTGKDHWEILLRARAIENQCYVLACGQSGVHENGRKTWGHSMLIDPWGNIVAQLPEGEGVLLGDIDSQLIAQVRRNLPALQHRVL